MLSYIFLGIFTVAAVLNLLAAGKKNKILFAVTKPMLLSALCLYCFFKSPSSPDLLIIGAFFACFIGDVLLMLRGEIWFTLGGVSFFAGHALFILVFARAVDFGSLPFAFLIPAALLYAGAAGFVMARAGKNAPKLMRVPVLLYLICNAATNLFALARAAQTPGVWTILAYVGAILFFISDCALFLMRYGNGCKCLIKTDFFVMLTYISGVLLIALGLKPL